jgi:GxxExxY protein
VRKPVSSSLPHAALTDAIIGCLYDVQNELGHGFSEQVYRKAMVIALAGRGLRGVIEPPLTVHFRGQEIGHFLPDIVVDDTIIVEVKATATLERYADAQLLNYLKAAGSGVGLLLNFGRKPEFERKVMGDPRNSLPILRERKKPPNDNQPY